MYENAVMLYDKDKDGALGFHNNEFALLVLQLLVRNEGPGVSKEHLNAGDRARKERAVHIARLIASHPGFSGQSGATPSALRAATEAGIFQELTPVMQSWIEGAVNKYLIRLYEQEIEAAKPKQQEIEGRRVVTAVRRQQPPPPRPGGVNFAQGTKQAPATPIIQRQGWGAAPEGPRVRASSSSCQRSSSRSSSSCRKGPPSRCVRTSRRWQRPCPKTLDPRRRSGGRTHSFQCVSKHGAWQACTLLVHYYLCNSVILEYNKDFEFIPSPTFSLCSVPMFGRMRPS